MAGEKIEILRDKFGVPHIFSAARNRSKGALGLNRDGPRGLSAWLTDADDVEELVESSRSHHPGKHGVGVVEIALLSRRV